MGKDKKNIEDKFDEFWSDDDQEEMVNSEKIYAQLRQRIQSDQDHFSQKQRLLTLSNLGAVAAALVLIVLFTWLFLRKVVPSQENLTNNQELILKTQAESQTLVLSDQSQVKLFPNSIIRYPKAFDQPQRQVKLMKGKALFEVKSAPNRPFLMHTEDLIIQVLGTSFEVDYQEDKTRVFVKSGKVSIQESSTNKQVELIAQESLFYQKSLDIFEKFEADKTPENPKSIQEIYLTIQFQNNSLKQITHQLQQETGLKFELPKYYPQEILFSKTYQNQSLQLILNDICKLYQLNYQQINNKVKLQKINY